MLNGSNDKYVNPNSDESHMDNYEDYMSNKRYFSSGSNDIIVESKTLLCENLLIIS